MTPKSPTPISVTMMLDDVNAGDLKKSSGTIGSAMAALPEHEQRDEHGGSAKEDRACTG